MLSSQCLHRHIVVLSLTYRHRRDVVVGATPCLELGAGDLSEITQLDELEEDVHFVFR